jgi:ATP-dependent DNA helicase RecG
MNNLKHKKNLKTPLQFLKGVGPKLSERFAKKGINSIEDLLYFLPIRYEDRSSIVTVRELVPGTAGGAVVEVVAAGEVSGRRRIYEVAVTDGTGILKLKWFNFKKQYMGRYKAGVRLRAYGNVTAFGAQKEIIHPDVEFFSLTKDKEEECVESIDGIQAVYSKVDNLHQKTIRKIIARALEDCADELKGAVPPDVLKRAGLITLPDAIRDVHLPSAMPEEGAMSPARRTLIFDELFSLELGLLLKREGLKRDAGIAFDVSGGKVVEFSKKLRSTLEFTLTNAQERVIKEISEDMASPHPMNRLVQGDVGSGKTMVSVMAILNAIGSGYQAALMAPTEILAEQHLSSIRIYLEPLGISCVLLKSGQGAAEKRKNIEAIRDGSAELAIGTHALIQGAVEFKRLGLAVIDEQHRFGVVQRAELRKKAGAENVSPDILVMTATPIPRTLSMTIFGELDVSVIDEMPKGRVPVSTTLLKERERSKAYELTTRELLKGRQAYVVCPLVEESEELDLRDATRMKATLEDGPFSDFKLALIHGRMKSEEKEAVMASFKSGKIDMLVATTVIEVGVDVPNATVMLIEHAERFGLAQLHQLRGRVGRGADKSYCVMLADYTPNEDTWRRLKIFESTTDGFLIAEEDLKIRGPGDFIGKRQSGLPEFRVGGVFSEMRLLSKARAAAAEFLKNDPALTSDDGKRARNVLEDRWAGRLELAEVG